MPRPISDHIPILLNGKSISPDPKQISKFVVKSPRFCGPCEGLVVEQSCNGKARSTIEIKAQDAQGKLEMLEQGNFRVC